MEKFIVKSMEDLKMYQHYAFTNAKGKTFIVALDSQRKLYMVTKHKERQTSFKAVKNNPSLVGVMLRKPTMEDYKKFEGNEF